MKRHPLAALLLALTLVISSSAPTVSRAGTPMAFSTAQQTCSAWDLSYSKWEIILSVDGNKRPYLLSLEEQKDYKLLGGQYYYDSDRKAYVDPLQVAVTISGSQLDFTLGTSQKWAGTLTSDTTMKGTMKQEESQWSKAGSYTWEATAVKGTPARCLLGDQASKVGPPECRETPLTRALDTLILHPDELARAIADAKEAEKAEEDKVFDTHSLLVASLKHDIALEKVVGNIGKWQASGKDKSEIIWPATLAFLIELRYGRTFYRHAGGSHCRCPAPRDHEGPHQAIPQPLPLPGRADQPDSQQV